MVVVVFYCVTKSVCLLIVRALFLTPPLIDLAFFALSSEVLSFLSRFSDIRQPLLPYPLLLLFDTFELVIYHFPPPPHFSLSGR